MIRVVLTDIEGTTTPITFVHRTLFPYARERLTAWVATHPDDPEVASLTAELGSAEAAVAQLLAWSDADVKATALKAIQGRVWAAGYADGTLVAPLYDDVVPKLRAWHAAGLRLAVFSSGSVPAQHLLFGHTSAGDLRPLFSGWFDTTTGPKREAPSYVVIAARLEVAPSEVLFLSDVEAELDAAAEAGMATGLLARDGQVPSGRHPVHADFSSILRDQGA
ncbi:MAG: acireductone synthase [Alphaproteobacteria bacterium]|nr:acireductone synthase [Alphaproteobacteria bacterium]